MNYVRSPILSLENAIASSAFRIAPELENELAEVRDQNNLSFSLVDEPGFSLRVLLMEGEVIINIAALEYLWASVHAHFVLFDEYRKAQEQGIHKFDTGGCDRRKNAVALLDWAVQNISTKGTAKWPQGLPCPEKHPEHESDVHVTNELFLCAIAWILHHEIAHVRLAHPPLSTCRSMSEEKEADIAATRWILSMSKVVSESTKRTFGIALAILAMLGLDEPVNKGPLPTHPDAFERIDYCLSEAGISEVDQVYAFASVIMQIQLAFRGIDKAYDGSSFKVIFSEYLIEFSRVYRDGR